MKWQWQLIFQFQLSASSSMAGERELLNYSFIQRITIWRSRSTWTTAGVPSDVRSFATFVTAVDNGLKDEARGGGDGAVLVHCLDGCGRTGVFLAALALSSQEEGSVYDVVLALRRHRPNMVIKYDFKGHPLRKDLRKKVSFLNLTGVQPSTVWISFGLSLLHSELTPWTHILLD